MGLFTKEQLDTINQTAVKSQTLVKATTSRSISGMNDELAEISRSVTEYFKDSPAILMTDLDSLHNYIDAAIASGYAGIDTETTGTDRVNDTIVGASLYYPGGVECYIPMKHLVPIFNSPYRDQLTYEQVGSEFQRLADSNIKLIFANADFDLGFIYKDLKVDLVPVCYYDVILAWRCLKENERDNSLKGLYNKYVLKGKGHPMKFSDFFSPKLFPYSKPEIAKLYAANDAKITYELFRWQLPYVTKDHPKCQKAKLERLADLVWNVEFPLIKVCQDMHRRGVYLDKTTAVALKFRYAQKLLDTKLVLQNMIQDILNNADYTTVARSPFKTGKDFNPNSSIHAQYLLKNLLHLDIGKSVDKNVLNDLNLPVTLQIVKVRNMVKLISTYVEKLPNATTADSRIHATFKSIGADTGRFSCIAQDMAVLTTNGYIPIQNICPGDTILCFDESLNLVEQLVDRSECTGHKNCLRLEFEDDLGNSHVLICTPEHPIRLCNGTYVQAQNITCQDEILGL